MIEVRLLVGAPSSGKSFYCRELMEKEPNRFKRINNDALRETIDFSVYSKENEAIIKSLREHLLREFIKSNYSILIDNVNAGKYHWESTLKICRAMNKDIIVKEIPFYLPLNELLERDSKREGKARVGEAVIQKFWKELGGEKFANYVPREEVLTGSKINDGIWLPMKQDEKKPRAVIFDNDGTISRTHPNRNPYDASSCDLDIPQEHTIEVLRLYFKAGYKILFVSGREEKHREPTERFYKKHFPEVEYELFLRPNADFRKDVIIKEIIFNEHIKGKYFVSGWFDDRLQIARWVYEIGLPLFRVGDPESSF